MAHVIPFIITITLCIVIVMTRRANAKQREFTDLL